MTTSYIKDIYKTVSQPGLDRNNKRRKDSEKKDTHKREESTHPRNIDVISRAAAAELFSDSVSKNNQFGLF
jgi:ERCC4-type nuclease